MLSSRFHAAFSRLLAPTCLLSLIVCLVCAPARAGTTGSLSGFVTDATSLAPVSGVSVSAVSPSQSATTTTDAGGKFNFLSLLPDTYVISVHKEGYEPKQLQGISVFADQAQTVSMAVLKSLKTIGTVTVRSSLSVVRPGTVTDVYSVNPALTSASAPLGGGGSLDQAYSAIASMPGAFVPPGQMGVNQTVYIRGGYYDQIGYEYDGVPVNRSFDNYPGHSASTFGQQELQIYTGGGSANSNASGLAGFINQVAKSGSYPGYANLSARVGTPTFYHDASFEVGGGTANRLFSYYVGFSGYNPAFRYLDQNNGAGLLNQFPYPQGPTNDTSFTCCFFPAVYPTCNGDATYTNPATAFVNTDPGCFSTFSPVYDFISFIAGRDAIGNFHFGIPHRYDNGRDDVQLLYTSSSQYRQYYSGVNDAGRTLVQGLVDQGDISQPHWPDFFTYPGGTSFLAPADIQPIAYLFPGSPSNRCNNSDTRVTVPGQCPDGVVSKLPADYRDARWDTANILKLQYQRNINDNSYFRIFGYTFYSNTNRSGASRRGIGSGFGATNFDYEVDTHTRGVQAQYVQQISDKNQITAALGYVTAATLRANNLNNFNTRNQQVSNLTNGSQCFATSDGTGDNGFDSYAAGDPAPCNDSISQGTFRHPTAGLAQNPCTSGDIPATSPACRAGAAFLLTYTGNQGGLNSLVPKFTNFALIDDWRPTPKLDLNFSVRISRDEFDLADTNTPGKNFWFGAAQREYCYNPVTLQPLLVPQAPQDASTLTPYVTFNCIVDPSNGVQTVHPDGANGHLLISNQYGRVYTQTYSEPRFGMTYTVNSDTVLRFSAGRYAQQPQNYAIQYNSFEENLAAQLIGFLPFGFNTPRHDALAQFSNNYDFSIEHHFPGTDYSVKLTPYYRWATDELFESANVPTIALSPAFNSGTQRTTGIEVQLTKGDFNRNGLSGVFSYTYTNSKERWSNYQHSTINPVDPYNQDIQNFNLLTKAGGGAPCYQSTADATADPTCTDDAGGAFVAIRNPYYNMAPQPLLDKFGWYDTGLDFPYVSPNTFSLVTSYRHNKFAITPGFTLNQGATYGTPADVLGVDPRVCTANNEAIPSSGGDPLRADYTSCAFAPSSSGSSLGSLFIPNPATSRFDSFGEFRQPWQFNMGLQLSYDINPKVTANLTVANLVNRCFGGSTTPWSKQYPPDKNVCGYISNTFYISNFYNGAGANDTTANGVPLNQYFAQPFVPSYGDVNSFNLPLPLQLYFQVNVKI
ncbi:MAG: hypothetical protein DLM53_04920 [Candidatus Eremiobacter antarcticus]|nr:TonB-dependent receptor [Candidatus Eremiobacteraeota bacterium]MBC5807874.1 TonB-dependent receptor [Candidatus Eremiobacteraeota bacterium]PZR62755.1 MAG: hypothetical protein DLM53_04920 [Candidatus Eremiobacter sp. RRmetagenome_bin22]